MASKIKDNVGLIIGAVFIALIIAGLFLLAKNAKEQNKIIETEESIARNETLKNSGGYFKGGEEAEVLIVEFSDFECPACKLQIDTDEEIINLYGDRIKFVFKHFPLESIHPNSFIAAEAAEAAGAQGKFWEMHDILFERSDEWASLSEDEIILKFTEYANEIGVENFGQFKTELEDGTYKDKVNQDKSLAENLGLNSTPTLYINGVLVKNRGLEDLKAAIDSLLNSSDEQS